MLSNLRELIGGTEPWPRFVRNRVEQFEARLSLVEVLPSPSLFLRGMEGSRLPVAVAHGEGRAEFRDTGGADAALASGLVALRFVDHHGKPAESYPANPNGSPGGITGLTSRDGRFTILMPHPERLFRTVQHSWHPDGWGEADALRNNMDAAEYKHVVLGLIFLKYISDAFEAKHAELDGAEAQGADPEDPTSTAPPASSGCRRKRAGSTSRRGPAADDRHAGRRRDGRDRARQPVAEGRAAEGLRPPGLDKQRLGRSSTW
jgi:hypothetical protein